MFGTESSTSAMDSRRGLPCSREQSTAYSFTFRPISSAIREPRRARSRIDISRTPPFPSLPPPPPLFPPLPSPPALPRYRGAEAGPFSDRHVAHAILRGYGRLHGGLRVFRGTFRERRDDIAGCGAHDAKRVAVLGLDPLAIDVHLERARSRRLGRSRHRECPPRWGRDRQGWR